MATGSITGSLAAQAQTSLFEAREQHALHQLQSASGGKSDAKIEKSAKEFESMLLSNWLQQAEQSMASVPEADEDEEHAGAGEPEGVEAHLGGAEPPGHDHRPDEGGDPGDDLADRQDRDAARQHHRVRSRCLDRSARAGDGDGRIPHMVRLWPPRRRG